MEYTIFKDIDRAERKWEEFLREAPTGPREKGPLASFGWLKTYEYVARKRGLESEYLISLDGDRRDPALLPMYYKYPGENQLPADTADTVLFGGYSGLAAKLGLSTLPTCILGVPISQRSIIMSGPGGPLQDYISLMMRAKEIALDRGASIFIPRVSKCDLGPFAEASVRINTPPTTYLDIKWGDFREYTVWLGKMGLNKPRTVRWECRRPEKKGTVIKVIKDDSEFRSAAWDMSRLADMTYRNYGASGSPYDEDFYRILKANMGDKVMAYASFRNGDMTSQVVMVRNCGEGAMLFGGNNRQKTRDDLAWFNTLFYRPIRDAIDSGIHRIYYGSRSYEYKLRRGCQIMPSSGYLVNRRGFAADLISAYSNLANYLLRRKYNLAFSSISS